MEPGLVEWLEPYEPVEPGFDPLDYGLEGSDEEDSVADALDYALKAGNADTLLEFLTSPMSS